MLCVFAAKPVKAQNDVQININVLPPYSAYLQDYAGAGKQVQVLVRNTTTTRLQVRLQGSVTGDNGVAIQTVPNYRPPVPLTLEPLQNRLLTYADLSNLFDLGQLDVQGVDRANLYKGLPLPEGSYQLCIRAFDNATSRPLSPENPLGCSPPFEVKSVEPPILIAPLCDSDVQVLTPQNLLFTWAPPIGVSPAMVDYTLRIVELPLETADPNVFIDAVVLPKSGVEVKGLRASTFLYSVVYPQLVRGKKYAWRVQARDLSGKTNFLNDGKSPVCAFQYGTVLPPDLAVVVVEKATQPILSALGQITMCGQTIQIKKITNPDPDHFTGDGLLIMDAPLKFSVPVHLENFVVRTLKSGKSKQAPQTTMVARGKFESSLKEAKVNGKGDKLYPDKHTGGTVEISYEAIRLSASFPAGEGELVDLKLLKKEGYEEVAIQTGLRWKSPIMVRAPTAPLMPVPRKGKPVGKLVSVTKELTVEVPGKWSSLTDAKFDPTLKIPFGQAYNYELADLNGFFLSLSAESYFEIENNRLKARLKGNLTIPSGRQEAFVSTVKTTFADTDGITFSEQIEDPQLAVGVITKDPIYTGGDDEKEIRVYLSFQTINVQLGDLYDADDLKYPQWVKGVSCPQPELWMGQMVYEKTKDFPSSGDHLTWMVSPINPVVNIGKGFESTNPVRKDLNIKTNYYGFKGKITGGLLVIKDSQINEVSHLWGKVYIPFIGAVGDLQIMVANYGLDDAEVYDIEKTERVLVETSGGDRVVAKVTGGYFENGLFYPDLSMSAYNVKNATRGIDARDMVMNATDVAITANGELMSSSVGKTAAAYYGGSVQKTALVNGLDYHLEQASLSDVPGGKNCRLGFTGTLVLGDKIVTNEKYSHELVFQKPKPDYDFEGVSSFTPISMPKGVLKEVYQPAGGGTPSKQGKASLKPKSGGPAIDESDLYELLAEADAAEQEALLNAPATHFELMDNKTLSAGYNTQTGYFNAKFTLFLDDATYGNGFRADVGMFIFQPVNTLTKATVIAGKAQNVKYWFAGFKYESKDTPGIPLFLDLEAYGFEGRLYSHMRHAGDPGAIFNDNYVPDANTSFGLYAAMPIQSVDAKGGKSGLLLWGKTGVEITFQGYVPNTITVRGDVNMEQLGGTDDDITSRIKGFATFVIAPKEKTLTGEVIMTKGDFGVACLTGSAYLYLGPSGFAVSVGSVANPITAKAMCGRMGDLTPSANMYLALYATNGSIGGMDWIPTSGIGVMAHMHADLLNFNTKTYLNNDPWASLKAGTDADLIVTIRPSLDLKARVGTYISLDVGYSGYSYNLANISETVQLTLPSFCLAYNKRICFPVLGGCNLIVGLKPGPYLRTNGSAADMCWDDGTVQGPCEGVIGWIMDGAQVVINAAGEVLDTAGTLIRDATGAVVSAAEDFIDWVSDWF